MQYYDLRPITWNYGLGTSEFMYWDGLIILTWKTVQEFNMEKGLREMEFIAPSNCRCVKYG